MARMKKVLAIAMAAAMGMSMLAGCGGRGKDDVTEATSQAETSEAATSEEKTEEAASEAAEQEKTEVKAGDVLIDLNFDDNDTDECHTYSNGGQAVLGAENGELCLDITGTGSLDYANQIYYDGFELNQDCVYELSFDVHSTIERGIQYRLQINGGDYHAYVMDDITIGTETQHISNQFTMSEASDPAPRMCMNLGHFEGVGDDSVPHKVYFDNIKLTVVDASSAQSVEGIPDPKLVGINQMGYGKDAKKLATVTDRDAKSYEVKSVADDKVVSKGDVSGWDYDPAVGDKCAVIDFSDVKDQGTYKIVLDTGAESYEFPVGDGVYDDIYKASVLMFYDQRCGTELDSAIAGDFAHAACHTGTAIVYGSDVAKDVTGGWHDAGDYGRYVVSGAKAVQDLLLTYEDSEYAAKDDAIGIPESGNGVPDVLDEVRYELDWMLKMQDAASGGVYHKVTALVFPETVLAVDETDDMVLAPISYAATADFAAVMAKASVLYAEYDADFAKSCLDAATNAYAFLEANPDMKGYENPEDLVTGAYDDTHLADETLWASAEMYIATKDAKYLTATKTALDSNYLTGFGWADIGSYALYDLAKTEGVDADVAKTAKEKLLADADETLSKAESEGFFTGMGVTYPWGSNMTITNKGMELLAAANLTGDAKYTEYAQKMRDYIFGVNPTGYCYVTGYGSLTPNATHHRPSQVLKETMPGMLVGGANNNLNDPYANAVLYGIAPGRAYVDNEQCYSCNEVTIYWNSPLIYLLTGLN